MGQKCHPYGFRVVYTKNWHSKWFSKREYANLLHEDLKLRRELKRQLHSLNAMVSKIDIERAAEGEVVSRGDGFDQHASHASRGAGDGDLHRTAPALAHCNPAAPPEGAAVRELIRVVRAAGSRGSRLAAPTPRPPPWAVPAAP